MEEIWRPIEDLEGYEVSNRGNIRSWWGKGVQGLVDTPHQKSLCKTSTSDYWYFKITGGQKSVHREVAKAFLENPSNLPCVNHLDEDKGNNHVSNLEWCTHEHNMQHSQGIEIKVKDPHGEEKIFPSVGALARAIGANNGNISRFVRGLRYKNGYKGWKLNG